MRSNQVFYFAPSSSPTFSAQNTSLIKFGELLTLGQKFDPQGSSSPVTNVALSPLSSWLSIKGELQVESQLSTWPPLLSFCIDHLHFTPPSSSLSVLSWQWWRWKFWVGGRGNRGNRGKSDGVRRCQHSVTSCLMQLFELLFFQPKWMNFRKKSNGPPPSTLPSPLVLEFFLEIFFQRCQTKSFVKRTQNSAIDFLRLENKLPPHYRDARLKVLLKEHKILQQIF